MAYYSAEVGSRQCSVVVYTNQSPGYSYKTNQYGLAIDNILGFNLVLPNGTVACVTQSTHPDLFFGLKGGFNNFVSPFSDRHSDQLTAFQGVVTDFTLKAYPQTEVWVRTVVLYCEPIQS